ncbi:hypothetical protein SAMN04488516_1176 [Desulfonauticus submarinus]|uniref:HTH cro/C1-type domain-containing protein n=2 Tax=Desulfonauticus submarinus TaxID=206665 RepID=A0A1H0G8U2_9BACT|nr:hypothetical protein SAMN04488516_1176 [Desulfonauticus submarinus]
MELSQNKMAKLLGMPLRTYQRLEQENVDIKSSVINKYAKIGVNINWLLTGDGPMFHGEVKQGGGIEIQNLNPRTEKVLKMFEMLDEEGKDDVLKYIEKIKQLKKMQKKIKELEEKIAKVG